MNYWEKRQKWCTDFFKVMGDLVMQQSNNEMRALLGLPATHLSACTRTSRSICGDSIFSSTRSKHACSDRPTAQCSMHNKPRSWWGRECEKERKFKVLCYFFSNLRTRNTSINWFCGKHWWQMKKIKFWGGKVLELMPLSHQGQSFQKLDTSI